MFSERPALHRYPRAMAARTQDLARLIVDKYGGDAAQLWQGAATGPELVRRIAELPGFGPAKAQIFAALLGKQLGCGRPAGGRRPVRSARTAPGCRSRISPTTTRWPRSAPTSKLKAAAKAAAAVASESRSAVTEPLD